MATAQSIIDAIDAAVLAMMAGGGAQSLSVGGRTVTFYSIDGLMKLRKEYSNIDAISDGNKLPFKLINTKCKGVNGAN